MSERHLQAEIDKFLSIDTEHKTHFEDHTPTLEEWKKKRNFYAEDPEVEELEDMWDQTK